MRKKTKPEETKKGKFSLIEKPFSKIEESVEPLSEAARKELNEELLQAVIDNDIEKVKTYLNLGGDKNYKLKEGKTINNIWFTRNSTLLIIASGLRYAYIAEELIKHKTDVNLQNKNGWTALMYAAMNGHIDICKILIENGADTNIQNEWGDTVLIWATRNEHTDIVRRLLSVGANPLLEENDGKTAYDSGNEETKPIIKAFENLWKRLGEKQTLKQTLLLIENINTAIRYCSPADIKEIFEEL